MSYHINSHSLVPHLRAQQSCYGRSKTVTSHNNSKTGVRCNCGLHGGNGNWGSILRGTEKALVDSTTIIRISRAAQVGLLLDDVCVGYDIDRVRPDLGALNRKNDLLVGTIHRHKTESLGVPSSKRQLIQLLAKSMRGLEGLLESIYDGGSGSLDEWAVPSLRCTIYRSILVNVVEAVRCSGPLRE